MRGICITGKPPSLFKDHEHSDYKHQLMVKWDTHSPNKKANHPQVLEGFGLTKGKVDLFCSFIYLLHVWDRPQLLTAGNSMRISDLSWFGSSVKTLFQKCFNERLTFSFWYPKDSFQFQNILKAYNPKHFLVQKNFLLQGKDRIPCADKEIF